MTNFYHAPITRSNRHRRRARREAAVRTALKWSPAN